MNRTILQMDSDARNAIIAGRLEKRYTKEIMFKRLGVTAISFALIILGTLFTTLICSGYTAFLQTFIKLSITIDESVIDPEKTGNTDTLWQADYSGLVKRALRETFPEVKKRRKKRKLYGLVSSGAGYYLRDTVLASPEIIGKTISLWVPASDDIDMYMKGYFKADRDGGGGGGGGDGGYGGGFGKAGKTRVRWLEILKENKAVKLRFNTALFTNGDSREPELAGILGALVGSLYTMVVTLIISFPVGVATAIYLEELAPKNRWIDFIEVNINNLAAVPSIVFGLLGLAIFINFFGLPRSAPIVGGLVLALITLPTIIIASRAALQSVPPSIRDAALGIGASPLQAIFHHALPSAMPGILTGAIIGMARALGETAPLLMIGMVAFIVDIPEGILDKATALPVQIYLWADSPERAFMERTSAAILVLLAFLITMNSVAVYLRRKFQKRW